jgi:hypothetical protein
LFTVICSIFEDAGDDYVCSTGTKVSAAVSRKYFNDENRDDTSLAEEAEREPAEVIDSKEEMPPVLVSTLSSVCYLLRPVSIAFNQKQAELDTEESRPKMSLRRMEPLQADEYADFGGDLPFFDYDSPDEKTEAKSETKPYVFRQSLRSGLVIRLFSCRCSAKRPKKVSKAKEKEKLNTQWQKISNVGGYDGGYNMWMTLFQIIEKRKTKRSESSNQRKARLE